MDRFIQRREEDIAPDREETTRGSLDVASLSDYVAEARAARLIAELADGRTLRFKVTYDPNEITDHLDNEVMDLVADGYNLAAAEALCRVILDWNLVGELTATIADKDEEGFTVFSEQTGRPVMRKEVVVKAGDVVPLIPEVVQHLRSDIFLGIWRAVREDAAGVPTSRRDRRRQNAQKRRQPKR